MSSYEIDDSTTSSKFYYKLDIPSFCMRPKGKGNLVLKKDPSPPVCASS